MGREGAPGIYPPHPAPVPTPYFKKAGSDFMILPIGTLLLSERATLPPQRDGFLEAEQSQPGKSSFSQIWNIHGLADVICYLFCHLCVYFFGESSIFTSTILIFGPSCTLLKSTLAKNDRDISVADSD